METFHVYVSSEIWKFLDLVKVYPSKSGYTIIFEKDPDKSGIIVKDDIRIIYNEDSEPAYAGSWVSVSGNILLVSEVLKEISDKILEIIGEIRKAVLDQKLISDKESQNIHSNEILITIKLYTNSLDKIQAGFISSSGIRFVFGPEFGFDSIGGVLKLPESGINVYPTCRIFSLTKRVQGSDPILLWSISISSAIKELME